MASFISDPHSKAVADAVTTAVGSFRDDREGDRHGVPSPSGIAHCRLQQWFNGRGIPRTNPVPTASVKKMESGVQIEGFWRDIYTRAGFAHRPLQRLKEARIYPFADGQGDGLLTVVEPNLPWPIGQQLLLELKDLGVWSFCDVVDGGLEEGLPDYYAQVQVYLGLYGLNTAIFHAGQADASSVTFVWKRLKKRETPPPPFYVEVVEFDVDCFNRLRERAADVRYHIEEYVEAPLHLRDYNAEKLSEKGSFPCGYCSWQDACLEAKRGKA